MKDLPGWAQPAAERTAAEELGIPPTPVGYKHEVYKWTAKPPESLESRCARLERELASLRGQAYRGPIMGADPGYTSPRDGWDICAFALGLALGDR